MANSVHSKGLIVIFFIWPYLFEDKPYIKRLSKKELYRQLDCISEDIKRVNSEIEEVRKSFLTYK